MIPTIISEQVQTGLQDYLRSTFPSKDAFFGPMIEEFISKKDLLFKGPYISIKLPFASSTSKANYFPDVPLGFKPYQHQQRSFKRLREVSARSTIIATGTGSGKTECFLYPVLDYCYHHRGESGIKAIIIYPMNALANDQATRFAETIHSIPHIKNNVTVGLYIGGIDTESNASVMTNNRVITDKEVLRENPPDILLTNYKMLDLLMVRERDSLIWKENGTETLKYIVVDELHTFDGAQGTDLACLIRRLKHRLGTPKNHLCCVGTSATIGGPEDADGLRAYASDMFQETFDEESIIMEETISPSEFLQGHEIDQHRDIFLVDRSLLDSSTCSSPEEYIGKQCKIWFGPAYPIDTIASLTGKKSLAEALFSHEIFQRLILALDGVLVTEEDLMQIMKVICSDILPEVQDDPILLKQLSLSLLSLITWARDPQASISFPFLHVRYQLWLKEMSRLTASVGEHPKLLFRDDKPVDQTVKDLPIVYCNECGATGWGTSKLDHENTFSTELDNFYVNYFNMNTNTYIIYPVTDEMNLGEEETKTLCADCLSIIFFNQTVCECGSKNLIKVFVYNPRKEFNGNVYGSHDCPFCHAHNSLTIAGRRTSSLISVALSQLFASPFNDDKKVLTFSDSVQDAAQRAGFFEARTWKFNFRIALKHFLDAYTEDLNLDEAGKLFALWWKTKTNEDNYIATFIPPDMQWLQSYKEFLEGGRGPLTKTLVSMIDKRLSWEITSEFGYNAVIGRTLGKTLAATVSLDYQKIQTVAESITERLQQNIGNIKLTSVEMRYLLIGLLKHMLYKGAIMHPALKMYVENSCNGYAFSHIGENAWFMPNLSMSSRLPEFVTIGRSREIHLNSVMANSKFSGISWYYWWLTSCLLPTNSQVEQYVEDIYHEIFTSLVSSKMISSVYGKENELIYGLNPTELQITTEVTAFRCTVCSHTLQVPSSSKDLWEQMPCIQHRCQGTYEEVSTQHDYYRNLYTYGDVNRIFAAEHTGLLTRTGREKLEESFKKRNRLTDPNLLSCTPTLEMGIDIGGLSSGILCSVPPNQANYLQRIGRAGRKDGNSFLLTVASGSAHDQYFYAEPKDMISGNVPAPHIYLNAPAVLERQFVAFCFDTWIKKKTPEYIIPRTMDELLKNIISDDPQLFPKSLFSFINLHRSELFDDFIDLFDSRLDESACTYLKSFVQGDNKEIQILEDKMGYAFQQFKKDQNGLISRWRLIRDTIREMKASKVKDKNYPEELSTLQSERAALHSFIKRNNKKELYNFLTDEGLLPNYAFPEAGVLLRSIILSKKTKPDEEGNFYKKTFEYERTAKSAIRELAPDNYFYAEGRKVKIDQIDLNASEITSWHF
jgi:DEAD/DEAH box helicase domain-containing protein